MCSATDGARPVSWCTCAASASFSSIVRGVPGVAKTLKRVPELPNAQEGSSIAWSSSWAAMSSKLVMGRSVPLSHSAALEPSSEDATECDPLGDGAVEDEVQRDERDRRHGQPGENGPGVGAELSLEVKESDRDRPALRVLEQHDGELGLS